MSGVNLGAKTLAQLERGKRAVIESIRLDSPSGNLLSALGLLPGKVVEIKRFAPLGDPMAISLEGQTISLRLTDAADVTVKEPS